MTSKEWFYFLFRLTNLITEINQDVRPCISLLIHSTDFVKSYVTNLRNIRNLKSIKHKVS